MAKESIVGMPSEADFRAESDMRTLIDAEKIKRDKKRLTAAMKKVEEQRAALSNVSRTKKET